MQRFLKLSGLLAILLSITTLSHAQTAYSADGNFLRLPSNYQPAQATAARPAYNGQGMGQGQMQAGQAIQAQPTVMTSASARMLPPGAAVQQMPQPMQQMQAPVAQPAMQSQTSSLQPLGMPVAQPAMQPSVQTMQPQLQPAIQPAVVNNDSPQAAVRPVVMSRSSGIAGSMPLTNNVVLGGQSNVQLRPACDTPSNHRAAIKGINTSTTIHGDCLN